jgi:hypothetical protein
MKTSTIPAIRVETALRAELERLLNEGETLSEFVEQSVRTALQRRFNQGEFIARGMASLDRAHEANEANEYIDADTVIAGLQRKLDKARTKQARAEQGLAIYSPAPAFTVIKRIVLRPLGLVLEFKRLHLFGGYRA